MSSILYNIPGWNNNSKPPKEPQYLNEPVDKLFFKKSLNFNITAPNRFFSGIKSQEDCETDCKNSYNCKGYHLDYDSKNPYNYNGFNYGCYLELSENTIGQKYNINNDGIKGHFDFKFDYKDKNGKLITDKKGNTIFDSDSGKFYKHSLLISDDYEIISDITNPTVNSMCRSSTENVQGKAIGKGYLTAMDCAKACIDDKNCTSFDIARRDKNKNYDCHLFTFKDKSKIIGETRNTGGAQGCFKKIK